MVAAHQVVEALSGQERVRRLISAGLGVRAKAEEIGKAILKGMVFKTFETFELAAVRPLSSFPELKEPVMPAFYRGRSSGGIVVAVYKFVLEAEFLKNVQNSSALKQHYVQTLGLAQRHLENLLRYKVAERSVYMRRDNLDSLGSLGMVKLHGDQCYFGVEVTGQKLAQGEGELRLGFIKMNPQ
jgi:hypothetical protein